MNIIKGILLSTVFIGNQCFALSCAMPKLALYNTTNIYPNSVFWVNYPINEDLDRLFLKSKNDQIKLIAEQISQYFNIYKLVPQKEMTENQNYSLSLKKPSSLEVERFDHAIMKTKVNTQVLVWETYPQLTKMVYEPNDTWEGQGSLTFKFKANIHADDFLLKIEYTNHSFSEYPQEIIIKPFAGNDNNESYFTLGFGECYGFNEVKFKPNQKIYLKFDLISHDGKIIPWSKDPIEISIQQPLEENSESLKELNWYQKIFNWVSKFVASIF